MATIGIDCGKAGGIAMMLDSGTISLHYTPTAKFKGVSDYMRYEMAALLRPFACELGQPAHSHAFVEVVSTRPKESNRSALTIGKGAGYWLGILAAFNIPTEEVEPAAWKRYHRLIGCDKDASRLRAQELFPGYHGYFQLKKSDGIAEALLIAEYGRRRLGSERKAA